MDHPIMLEVELRGSTTHLVFGEGVARSYSRMLEKYAVQDPPDIIPVGSSSVDRIAREAARPTGHRKHKRILYVTTSYLLNTWYISFVRREFDENLWQVQRDILRVFAEHPENEYIIKLHPGHSSRKPIADYLEDIGLTNVRLIVKEERIEDLYDWADNILLDLISTSILQVCTTEKPIHVYSGLYQYDREVIRLLAKRASVYEEKDEFIEGVKQAVQGHETTVVDPGNKEFLECFGTHLSDGRAAQRASEVVRDVLLRK